MARLDWRVGSGRYPRSDSEGWEIHPRPGFAIALAGETIEAGLLYEVAFTIDEDREFLVTQILVAPSADVVEGGVRRPRRPDEYDEVGISIDDLRAVRINDLRKAVNAYYANAATVMPGVSQRVKDEWIRKADGTRKHGRRKTAARTLAQWTEAVLRIDPDGGPALHQLRSEWPDLRSKTDAGASRRIQKLRREHWITGRLPKAQPGPRYVQWLADNDSRHGKGHVIVNEDGTVTVEMAKSGIGDPSASNRPVDDPQADETKR